MIAVINLEFWNFVAVFFRVFRVSITDFMMFETFDFYHYCVSGLLTTTVNPLSVCLSCL